MSLKRVYVALSQFCEDDDAPRRALVAADLEVHENRTEWRLQGAELVAAAAGAAGVIAGTELYDARTLEALPDLRCLSRCGVGVDAIDMDTAQRRGVTVLTTPDVVAEPVAQLTIGMILALARQFPEHVASMREGQWTRRTGFLLSEWTIGLVGFGRIGQAVERLLRPFGPSILVSSPSARPEQMPTGVSLVDLDTLLARADLVSLHAARKPADGPLLRSREIARMKPGARLVNTSRGYLLDEEALLEALRSGHIAGASLDVYRNEPYAGPLSALPQVLCTPHIGTLTRESRRAMELKAVANLIDFLRRTEESSRLPQSRKNKRRELLA